MLLPLPAPLTIDFSPDMCHHVQLLVVHSTPWLSCLLRVIAVHGGVSDDASASHKHDISPQWRFHEQCTGKLLVTGLISFIHS